jgi:hypothetical protein
MTSHVTSHEPRAARVARRSRAAQLFGSFALALFAFPAGALFSPPAEAARLCGDRDDILQRLEQRHEETPQALGLSSDGGVLEVLVSPTGGWTILVTYPKRPTCVVAVGEAWQPLQLATGEPA